MAEEKFVRTHQFAKENERGENEKNKTHFCLINFRRHQHLHERCGRYIGNSEQLISRMVGGVKKADVECFSFSYSSVY